MQKAELNTHVPRMRRIALRLLGDLDEAEEAVQDACMKALRSLSTFNGQSHLTTWLHQIVTRCALDRIRTKQRRSRYASEDGNAALMGAVAYVSEGPFEQAQRNELRTIVSACIAALPDNCREAFAMTQLDGYSYNEAAGVLGVPRGTIASRVFRGKRMVTEQLRTRLNGDSRDG